MALLVRSGAPLDNSLPFFSVIIPTYNREKFIASTIHSLLVQEYGEFEIIVIDDGSSDNTEQVVKAINDRRIHYVKQINGERGHARNCGTKLARGQYVNFFDSDDLAHAIHLVTAKEEIIKLQEPELLHFGYDIRSESGKIQRVLNNFPSEINSQLIDGNHLTCNCVFVRKDVALKFPFNEDRRLSVSEDYELWLRLAARFKFHSVNIVTTSLINHDTRSVLDADPGRLIVRIEYLIDSLKNDEMFVQYYRDRISIFESFLNVYVALHLGMAGKRRKSLLFLIKAIKLQPSVIFTRRFAGAFKSLLF